VVKSEYMLRSRVKKDISKAMSGGLAMEKKGPPQVGRKIVSIKILVSSDE